jgi:protein-S-isoprenylcysteine O-methyltransferase Ste14
MHHHPLIASVIAFTLFFAVTGLPVILLFILVRMIRKRRMKEADIVPQRKKSTLEVFGDGMWAVSMFIFLTLIVVSFMTGFADSRNLILACLGAGFAYRIYRRKTQFDEANRSEASREAREQ